MVQEKAFGLKDLLQILMKKIWIILLTIFIFISAAGIISYFFLTPVYETKTTIIIGNSPKQEDGYDYDDVLMYQQLAKTYHVIAKSKTVAEKTAKKLGQGVTPEEVSRKTTINTMTDTQVIEIITSSISSKDAERTANTLADAFIDEATRIFPSGNVQILDKASLPDAPVSPRPVLNIVIAFLMGFLISAGIIILSEYLDSTVKTENDVYELIRIPVVGIIPQYKEK